MADATSQCIRAWQTHSTKADLRSQLRSLWDANIAVPDHDIASAFDTSDYVGSASNQISPRPTGSGLRDSLPIEVLTMCVMGKITAHEVLDAIGNNTCDANPSPKSKTGVHFGWPIDVGVKEWNAFANDHDLFTTKEKSMSEDMSLDDLVSAYSILTDYASEEDVREVFVEVLGSAKATGVFSTIEVGVTPDRSDDTRIGAMATFIDLNDKLKAHVDGGVEEPTASAPGTYELPDEDKAKLINMTLATAGLPDIGALLADINSATAEINKLKSAPKMALPTEPSTSTPTGDSSIPSGSVRVEEAYKVFGITGAAKKQFTFDVPVWTWDAPHPHVPQVDENYQFQPQPLMRVLYSIITNNRCYLHGHTGSGKTTLVEQVAARLCYPFMRLNFDSEITRMDLIGRDVLTTESDEHGNTNTVSSFVDGILPQMMQGPYIGCFDEIDFVRPDVSYVMQRVFEGNGLLITEDGGRVVKPHRMFRMFATGNTVGQGDEFGMYQGARPQSIALLDRFTVWSHIDYMPKHARKKLIAANASRLEESDIDKIDAYVHEHLQAFKEGKVLQPISPRGFIALGQAVMAFYTFYPAGSETKAFQQAFETTILDRATVQDKVVLQGIAQRVFS